MNLLSDRIVEVTERMQEALARDDLEQCTVLLEERGRLLAEMASRYKSGAADPRWQKIIAKVQELDADMSQRLHIALSETAQELGRLRHHKQGSKTEHTPRYINHRV